MSKGVITYCHFSFLLTIDRFVTIVWRTMLIYFSSCFREKVEYFAKRILRDS